MLFLALSDITSLQLSLILIKMKTELRQVMEVFKERLSAQKAYVTTCTGHYIMTEILLKAARNLGTQTHAHIS